MLFEALLVIGKFGIANAPTILSIIGEAGVAITGYLSAKSGMEYQKRIDDGEELNAKDTATIFAKPVISGAVTMGCIFTGNHLHIRRRAAVMAAANIIQKRSMLKDVAMEQMQGDIYKQDRETARESADQVTAETIWDKCKRNGIKPIDTDSGTKLWYEPISQQFFLASSDHVTDAIAKLIDEYTGCGYAVAGSFIRYLELPAKPGFNNLVWDQELGETYYGYSTIQIGMRDKKLRDGTEYTQIYYYNDPHLSEK